MPIGFPAISGGDVPDLFPQVAGILAQKAARNDEFAKQKALLKQREESDELKDVLKVGDVDYSQINPHFLNDAFAAKKEFVKSAWDAFNHGQTQSEKSQGIQGALDQFDQKWTQLQNTSKTWNSFAEQHSDALDIPQKQAMGTYSQIPYSVQGKDFLEAMNQTVANNKLGSMVIDPQSGAVGLKQSPKLGDAEKIIDDLKANPITVTPMGGAGKDLFYYESFPKTNEDAQKLQQQMSQVDPKTGQPKYSIGNLASIESLTDGVIAKLGNGNPSNAVLAYLHDDPQGYAHVLDGSANDAFNKDGTPNKNSVVYKELQAKYAPPIEAKVSKMENIPKGATTINKMGFNQEVHTLVTDKYAPVKEGGTEYDTHNFVKTNIPVGNVSGEDIPAVNPSTGKKVEIPDLANATIIEARNREVDADGNFIPKGSKKKGIQVPMILVSTSETESGGTAEQTPKAAANTAEDPFGTQKTGSTSEHKSESQKQVTKKYWIPMKGYEEFFVTKEKYSRESLNANYVDPNEKANANLPADLRQIYNKYYRIGGADESNNQTNLPPSGL